MKEKSQEMINSVIGQGSVLKGTAEIQGSIRIDGEVEGELAVSEAIVVGKSGVLRADIRAKTVVVGGKILGNVSAGKRIELEAGSHLEGDVTTSCLVIAEGVFFQGNCRMDGESSRSGPSQVDGQREEAVSVDKP